MDMLADQPEAPLQPSLQLVHGAERDFTERPANSFAGPHHTSCKAPFAIGGKPRRSGAMHASRLQSKATPLHSAAVFRRCSPAYYERFVHSPHALDEPQHGGGVFLLIHRLRCIALHAVSLPWLSVALFWLLLPFNFQQESLPRPIAELCSRKRVLFQAFRRSSAALTVAPHAIEHNTVVACLLFSWNPWPTSISIHLISRYLDIAPTLHLYPSSSIVGAQQSPPSSYRPRATQITKVHKILRTGRRRSIQCSGRTLVPTATGSPAFWDTFPPQ